MTTILLDERRPPGPLYLSQVGQPERQIHAVSLLDAARVATQGRPVQLLYAGVSMPNRSALALITDELGDVDLFAAPAEKDKDSGEESYDVFDLEQDEAERRPRPSSAAEALIDGVYEDVMRQPPRKAAGAPSFTEIELDFDITITGIDLGPL